MPRLAYGMFLEIYLCRWLLMSYRCILSVEKEGDHCLLKTICQYPEKGRIYRISQERERKLLVSIIKETASTLSNHMAMGRKNRQFVVKLYFRKEEEQRE